MSASNKKKLRKEQEAEKLTEKQLTAQKEAKKTNLYTTLFIVAMAVILVLAITIGVKQTVSNSGIRERKTIAMTVGTHELSNAELNYYYIDSINNFLSQYGSYAAMFGLDTTLPLDEQYVDAEQTATWADDFLSSAKESAKTVYAICDAAEAEGFTLSEEEQTSIDTTISNLSAYAMLYGYSEAEDYLKAMYGNGATLESFQEYMEATTLYSAYQQHYSNSLTYDDADIQAADSKDYTSYDYHTYYLAASRFAGEDGEVTAEAVAAAEEAAKTLVGEGTTNLEAFDAAIAALDINKESNATSNDFEGTRYSSISSIYGDWLADSGRKEGDVSYFANNSTTSNEDGTETTTTNGYYVVLYLGTDDNRTPLKNIRHILVSFQGGTTDETTGTTYSDAEKAVAKLDAETVLSTWESGEATEESFAALAMEKSTDTGSVENGGLYENVYPGQMVEAFEDWCFDESRKPGDTGIVETEYGYHVMYFVGDSDITYRNYLIETDLRTEDVNNWYNGLIEGITVTDGDTKYINTSLTLSAS